MTSEAERARVLVAALIETRTRSREIIQKSIELCRAAEQLQQVSRDLSTFPRALSSLKVRSSTHFFVH